MPQISVIMPVYNKENYVATAIKSICEQTFSDFELIIIDDGSTDRSGEICDQCAHKDQRIIVHHIVNRGVSHARNIGLQTACGEYITYVDSDDIFSKTLLENLINVAVKHHVKFVLGGITKRDLNGNETQCLPGKSGRYPMSDFYCEMVELQKNTGVLGYCTAKLIHRDITNHIWFDERLCLAEDLDYYLRIYDELDFICFLNESDYIYNQGTENSAVSMDDYKIDYQLQLQIKLRFIKILKNHQCFHGQNEFILKNDVGDYITFSLFYHNESGFKDFKKTFKALSIANLKSMAKGNLKGVLIPVWFLYKVNCAHLCYWYIQCDRRRRNRAHR